MYVVVKTIKGKQYRYLQRSYRASGKVRTESIYLGPAGYGRTKKGIIGTIGEFVKAQQLTVDERAMATAERAAESIAREQRVQFGETATERAARERQGGPDRLHEQHGLKIGDANPTPVEAPTASDSPVQDAPSSSSKL